MKRKIKGQIYDTDKAQLIAAVELRKIYQALYLKRSNEFFLHSMKDNQDTITPLTWLQADEWARMFLSPNSYEKLFGDIPEDAQKMNISIRLRSDTYQKLKRISCITSRAASDLIEELLINLYDSLRNG